MDYQLLVSSTYAQWLTAAFTGMMVIGTFLVAILAVYGEPIRNRLLRPEPTFRVSDVQGEAVTWEDGAPGLYYHLSIENHGRATAKKARVFCLSIDKRGPDGDYHSEKMVGALQMQWRFSSVFGEIRDIPVRSIPEICDLGCIRESFNEFRLTPYAQVSSTPSHVGKGESIRLTIVIAGDNFAPTQLRYVWISWDGIFSSNPADMAKHLVVQGP